MNSTTIKKKVSSFIRKQGINNISFISLTKVIEDLGYTIIQYNNLINSDDVAIIINNLNLQDIVSCSRGFTYVGANYRLVFIHEDLSDEEKMLVLAHELGHIVCKHLKSDSIIGNDVKEEYEANEFAHYLLHQTCFTKIKNCIIIKKKASIGILFLLIFIVVGAVLGICYRKQQSFYREYYITISGKKYHREECIYVKDKITVERLTKEDFEAGTYQACRVCLPDD